MIHRLISLPLSEYAFNQELHTIKRIASNNNINLDIDNVVRKKQNSLALDSITSLPRDFSRSRIKWFRLPYLGKISENIRRTLKPLNLRPTFYSLNTVQRLFCHLKDPIPKDERSGVYKISCGDCDAVYIGETGRQLKVRIKEHLDAVRKNRPERSTFASHLLQSGHSVDRIEVSLLHIESSFRKRLTLESIQIIKHDKSPTCTLVNEYIPDSAFLNKIYS